MAAAAAVDEDEADHLVVEDQRYTEHGTHIPVRHGPVMRAGVVESVGDHHRLAGGDHLLAEPIAVEAGLLAPHGLGDVARLLAVAGGAAVAPAAVPEVDRAPGHPEQSAQPAAHQGEQVLELCVGDGLGGDLREGRDDRPFPAEEGRGRISGDGHPHLGSTALWSPSQ